LAVEEAFGTCALEEACTFDSGIVDASSSSAGPVAAFGLALAQPSAVPFEVAGEALVAELDLKEIVLAKVPGCKPIVCLQKLVALTAAAAVVVLVVVAVVDVQTAVVFDEAGKLWMHHFELALVVFVVSAAAPVASLAFVAFAVVVASSAAASFGMLAFVVVAFEEALAVVVEFVEALVVVVAFVVG